MIISRLIHAYGLPWEQFSLGIFACIAAVFIGIFECIFGCIEWIFDSTYTLTLSALQEN